MGTIFLPWAGWQFRRLGPVVTFSTELRPTSPDKNKQIRKPPPPTRVSASRFTSRVVHWIFVLPLGGAEVRIINLRWSHVEPRSTSRTSTCSYLTFTLLRKVLIPILQSGKLSPRKRAAAPKCHKLVERGLPSQTRCV